MATVKDSLAMDDSMGAMLKSITSSMNVTISTMERMKFTSDNIDLGFGFEEAKQQIVTGTIEMQQMEMGIRNSAEGQNKLNQQIKKGSGFAEMLKGKISGFMNPFTLIKNTVDYIKTGINGVNSEINALAQLSAVTGNIGIDKAGFDDLVGSADSMSKSMLYGKEQLIGGATELAAYMSDPEAIKSMMGTMSNYAAGMSGGGELSQAEMVDYAAQLGKVLEGSYDGIAKKGFVLSDAQKEIINNGSDMEKALVIDEVISQSWSGLAEQMANTPEGKLIKLKQGIDDVKKSVSSQLYPAILSLVDMVTANMPKIQEVANSFATGINVVIVVLQFLIEKIIGVYDFFVNNWSIISPIIYGIATAMLIYTAVLTGHNAVQKISNKLKATAAFQEEVLAAKKMITSGETFKETVAQHGLNAALLACPVTWIIISIIALIAVIYLVIAVINKFAGTSISATGIILGAFAALGTHLYNSFIVPTWNVFAAFVNFLANVFNDPVAAIKILFLDMADSVIGYVANMAHAIEDVINKIPGVSIDITSGLDKFQSQIKTMAENIKSESEWIEVVGELEYKDYGDAFNKGYTKGKEIDSKFGDIFNFKGLDLDNIIDTSGLSGLSDDFVSDISNEEFDVNVKDDVNLADESLKYLLDSVTQRYINEVNLTTPAPAVTVQFTGDINRDVDLDELAEKTKVKLGTEMVEYAMASTNMVY